MTGVEIVQDIVEILVAGLTELGSGIGSGVANFVDALAFTGTGENKTMSIYFILIICFAGVALAVGLTTKLFNWLSNLGN